MSETGTVGGTGEKPGIAAFDFDGTLTRKDTLAPFLVRAHGWRRLTMAVLAGRGALRDAATSDHALLRDRLKIATIDHLFSGMSTARLGELAQDYAAQLAHRLRPEMLDRLRWHQDRNHAVVIVSASLAAYLRPLAAELDIDDVLAVELVADSDGFLTGAVAGGVNTRGPHKLERLHAWIEGRFGADTTIELWAYGNSVGDRELLTAADHPTWVGRRRR